MPSLSLLLLSSLLLDSASAASCPVDDANAETDLAGSVKASALSHRSGAAATGRNASTERYRRLQQHDSRAPSTTKGTSHKGGHKSHSARSTGSGSGGPTPTMKSVVATPPKAAQARTSSQNASSSHSKHRSSHKSNSTRSSSSRGPQVVRLSAEAEAQAICYAKNYPDLLHSYCTNANVSLCYTPGLDWHWNNVGKAKGWSNV